MRSRVLGLLCVVVLAGTFTGVPTLTESQPAEAIATTSLCHIAPGDTAVGIASTTDGMGYWIATARGYVLAPCFGDANPYGQMGGKRLNAPIVGITATSDGKGFWLVASDGGVFAFGDASFYGSMGGKPLNAPVVGMAATSDGGGYWLAAADGGAFAFGDARFGGSYVGVLQPGEPVVAIASLPIEAPNEHYIMATAKGDVAAFGFTGGSFPGGYFGPLNAPMTGIAWAGGLGWWIAAADGGVFAAGAPDQVCGDSGCGYVGNTPFYGSIGGKPLNAPMVGIAATPSKHGYWLIAADGGVFAFGNALFFGSAA